MDHQGLTKARLVLKELIFIVPTGYHLSTPVLLFSFWVYSCLLGFIAALGAQYSSFDLDPRLDPVLGLMKGLLGFSATLRAQCGLVESEIWFIKV